MTADAARDFDTVVWRHHGDAAWFFATLPFELADEFEHQQRPRRGFGSVRVEVTVGGTTWRTSLFPDTKERSYVLPVKRAVREREGIDDGDRVQFRLRLIDN